MDALELPEAVDALAARLAALPGVVAVALGGSRATGAHRPDSDWDLGVYHRPSVRALDPSAVLALGHPGYVSALGEWGPIVDGGAWLTVEGLPVDVLFRDLDRIDRWCADAEGGRFEILAQTGHLAGAPTYLPMGELALCRVLAGELPRPAFPAALAATAPPRWEARAQASLLFAGLHARAGDVIPCAGMLAHAVLSSAHGRLAANGEWALNEKRLVARAGLGGCAAHLARPGATASELESTVGVVAEMLGVEPLSPR